MKVEELRIENKEGGRGGEGDIQFGLLPTLVNLDLTPISNFDILACV